MTARRANGPQELIVRQGWRITCKFGRSFLSLEGGFAKEAGDPHRCDCCKEKRRPEAPLGWMIHCGLEVIANAELRYARARIAERLSEFAVVQIRNWIA